ncbi:MAG: MBL fold metallo-hydrolase [Clostridiaceae bacterium]|nr:MBL fold metallo-hydrolase [Clostridiaceae bacterium]
MEERFKAAAEMDLRLHFADYWRFAFDQRDDHTVSLIAPASYVLDADGTRLVIDPVFRFPWMEALVADVWTHDLANVDGVLYTHRHGDHYSPSTAHTAAASGARVYLPAFFPEAGEDSFTAIEAGRPFQIGRLRITPFTSPHFDADHITGVPEYGYLVETSRRTLLFPGDVRLYDPARLPPAASVDTVFAHVWLGRGNALRLPCEPYVADFARFVLAHHPRRVYLAHLYEIGRTPEELWTYTHAGLCADAIAAEDRGVSVAVLRYGFRYEV